MSSTVDSGPLPSPWRPPPRLLALLSRRRHTPYGNQTDYRIFELNKRLQNWTEVGRGGQSGGDTLPGVWSGGGVLCAVRCLPS